MLILTSACSIKQMSRVICECPCCEAQLYYNPSMQAQALFSGDKCYCSRCGTNVTELVYGKPKTKSNGTN